MLSVSAASVFNRRTSRMFSDMKRRAAKYRLALPFTLAELRAWLAAQAVSHQAWRCVYCGGLLVEADVLLDHATPINRRVSVEAFALENLVVCCREDNESKGGAMDAEEYRQLRGFLKAMHPAVLPDTVARLRAGNRRFVRGRR